MHNGLGNMEPIIMDTLDTKDSYTVYLMVKKPNLQWQNFLLKHFDQSILPALLTLIKCRHLQV